MQCFTCPLHFFFPRKFSYVRACCPGILNMYPCNIKKPMDFKTKSAAISRILMLREPKSAANSRPWERGTSLGKKTTDPLRNPYVGKFQKNISMRLLHINILGTFFYVCNPKLLMVSGSFSGAETLSRGERHAHAFRGLTGPSLGEGVLAIPSSNLSCHCVFWWLLHVKKEENHLRASFVWAILALSFVRLLSRERRHTTPKHLQ